MGTFVYAIGALMGRAKTKTHFYFFLNKKFLTQGRLQLHILRTPLLIDPLEELASDPLGVLLSTGQETATLIGSFLGQTSLARFLALAIEQTLTQMGMHVKLDFHQDLLQGLIQGQPDGAILDLATGVLPSLLGDFL